MRLPRLYAPYEVQLIEVRFADCVEQAWSKRDGPLMLDQVSRWLGQQASSHELALHAWALTPRRLVLLATPGQRDASSRVVQSVGRRLGALLRSGSVFANRFKSTLVDADWVLRAQAWVESGPVLDGYAPRALSWRWSSAVTHVGQIDPKPRDLGVALIDHSRYWACGNTPFDRQAYYLSLLDTGLSASDSRQIEASIAGQWALGDQAYLQRMSKVANRRATAGRRGRPRKVPEQIDGNDDPSPINQS